MSSSSLETEFSEIHNCSSTDDIDFKMASSENGPTELCCARPPPGFAPIFNHCHCVSCGVANLLGQSSTPSNPWTNSGLRNDESWLQEGDNAMSDGHASLGISSALLRTPPPPGFHSCQHEGDNLTSNSHASLGISSASALQQTPPPPGFRAFQPSLDFRQTRSYEELQKKWDEEAHTKQDPIAAQINANIGLAINLCLPSIFEEVVPSKPTIGFYHSIEKEIGISGMETDMMLTETRGSGTKTTQFENTLKTLLTDFLADQMDFDFEGPADLENSQFTKFELKPYKIQFKGIVHDVPEFSWTFLVDIGWDTIWVDGTAVDHEWSGTFILYQGFHTNYVANVYGKLECVD